MTPSDLIRDPGTGQLSVTKIWANVAYLAGTVVFLSAAIGSCEVPDADVWLIYLGVVGSHCTVSKLISLRYGGGGRGYDPHPARRHGRGSRGGDGDLSGYRDDLEGP